MCSQTLVSVSTVGTLDKMSEADLVKSVQRELKEWFGPEASTWVFMRNYRIPYAQPNQVCEMPVLTAGRALTSQSLMSSFPVSSTCPKCRCRHNQV